jgi:hypothetical protein
MTPSLLVSLPAIESNEAAMRSTLRTTSTALRPHFKAHKSSALAQWQMRLNATAGAEGTTVDGGWLAGFCTQTITETEALVKGTASGHGTFNGLSSVLLTNSPGQRGTADRLARLQQGYPACQLSAVVDCMAHVHAMEQAIATLHDSSGGSAADDAATTSTPPAVPSLTLGALVEIECGQDRCVRCSFSDVLLHSTMPLSFTPLLRLTRCHACDQYHSFRVFTLLPVGTVNHVATLKGATTLTNPNPIC